jgi:hypothetical protein
MEKCRYIVYNMHGLFNEIYDLSGFCIFRPLKDGIEQGVTKICRLSWLTKSAPIYEPKSGGGGEGSQPRSTAVHMEPK